MAIVYLSLGSNIGKKEEHIARAVQEIKSQIGEVTALSDFFYSAPLGFESEHEFVNVALCLQTTLTPLALLHAIQQIEVDLGRTSKSIQGVYQDRMIDIDILFYDNDTIHTPILTIPHPAIAERNFVLQPLVEIAPTLIHPLLNRSIVELLRWLTNPLDDL